MYVLSVPSVIHMQYADYLYGSLSSALLLVKNCLFKEKYHDGIFLQSLLKIKGNELNLLLTSTYRQAPTFREFTFTCLCLLMIDILSKTQT